MTKNPENTMQSDLLSFEELIGQIPDLMPKIVSPVVGGSIPLKHMIETIVVVDTMVDTANQILEAYDALEDAYHSLWICFEDGFLRIDPTLVIVPFPKDIAVAGREAIAKGEESLQTKAMAHGTRLAFDRAWELFKCLREGDVQVRSQRLPDVILTGCEAVNWTVSALSAIGLAFKASSNCRGKILAHKELADARDKTVDQKARAEILKAVAAHKQLCAELIQIFG
jgi:hypothetical protein